MSFAHQSGAGGVNVHSLLTGLDADDHTQYALLAGRAAGQALIGGQAASENLTLQSTAHATRGYVRAQDDLQLLSNILRDSGGTERLKLATASPHLQLTGDLKLTGWAALAGGTPASDAYLKINPAGVTWPDTVGLIQLNPSGCSIGVGGSLIALTGNATPIILAGAAPVVRGLSFQALVNGPGNPIEESGLWVKVGAVSLSGTMTDLHNIWAAPASIFFTGAGAITRSYGLRIGNQGKAAVGTTFGLLIEPQAGSTSRYSIWAGALYTGTPRLRLDEGDPAADLSQLWLAVNNGAVVLRQVQIGPADSGGVGYRYLRMLN